MRPEVDAELKRNLQMQAEEEYRRSNVRDLSNPFRTQL